MDQNPGSNHYLDTLKKLSELESRVDPTTTDKSDTPAHIQLEDLATNSSKLDVGRIFVVTGWMNQNGRTTLSTEFTNHEVEVVCTDEKPFSASLRKNDLVLILADFNSHSAIARVEANCTAAGILPIYSRGSMSAAKKILKDYLGSD